MATSVGLGGGVVFFLVSILFIFRLFTPKIVKLICSVLFSPRNTEVDLREKVKWLRRQQEELDLKEDFVKHAKLQREINKLDASLKTIRNEKASSGFMWSTGLKVLLNTLHTFGFVFLLWYFRNVPMVTLKEEWTWPLTKILSFPCSQPGSIGVTWWIFISRTVFSRIYAYGTSFLS